MASVDCFVSVVAPLYNDARIVDDCIDEVMTVLQNNYSDYEVVLIDDGSEDDTVDRITLLMGKYRCLRLIRLSKKFGEEIAIAAGLDSVIGDYVVVMMPDCDSPGLIPEMVRRVRRGAGIVFGIRNNRSSYSYLVRVGSSLFHWYCERMLKINLPKGSTEFRVLSRQAVNAIIRIKDRYRYFRIVSSNIGYASESFVYEPISRKGKPRRIGFFEAAKIALNIIIKTSTHPLRFVSWLGIAAGMLNGVYTGFVIYSYIFGDQIAPGWTTLSLQNAAMFFLVFLILTVLSEYVGRILVEGGERPLYYVLDERTSSVLVSDEERKNVVTEPIVESVRGAGIRDSQR